MLHRGFISITLTDQGLDWWVERRWRKKLLCRWFILLQSSSIPKLYQGGSGRAEAWQTTSRRSTLFHTEQKSRKLEYINFWICLCPCLYKTLRRSCNKTVYLVNKVQRLLRIPSNIPKKNLSDTAAAKKKIKIRMWRCKDCPQMTNYFSP